MTDVGDVTLVTVQSYKSILTPSVSIIGTKFGRHNSINKSLDISDVVLCRFWIQPDNICQSRREHGARIQGPFPLKLLTNGGRKMIYHLSGSSIDKLIHKIVATLNDILLLLIHISIAISDTMHRYSLQCSKKQYKEHTSHYTWIREF